MLWFNFIPLGLNFIFLCFKRIIIHQGRDCTLFMAKGVGGGGSFQNQWKWGVPFSNAVEFWGGTPF